MNKFKILIMFLIFIFSVFLIIEGQTIKGYFGLLIMLVGLAMIIVELYLYNKKYV
ncbi:DUF6903 family protein [Candidatus Clostridium radicumherbarum]|uniref:DUF6903 family protein n=1 Tax=Candidatus Clostridium radicumherbarum TaxID=3381662 RepID=A0ABW8TPU4_9CLOT